MFKKRFLPYLFAWLFITGISITVIFNKPIYLNENQILYLFSAAAQVIAAVYGLIITGYIFFRNELDRKVADDDSLEEIVKYLKDDYYVSIIYISVVTLLSIILCILTISLETYSNVIVLNIIINVSISTILLELSIIIAFVIKILNPNSFELASNKIINNNQTMNHGTTGSLEQFLQYFNSIEYILEKYGNAYIDIANNREVKYRKSNIAKSKLVQIIYKEGKISDSLRQKLLDLISFRNGLIHGTDLSISEEAVENAKQIYEEFNKAL